MTDKSEWQGRVGETWADEWKRTDRSFSALTDALLARMRGLDSRHVLDIGCGAGELSLAIARGRPDAMVTGLDVSPHLIEVARKRAAHLANVQFIEGDAAKWRSEDGNRPGLLVSRHGTMFFDDPVAAFGHLAQQSEDKADLVFSSFRAPAENPFFSKVMRLLPDPPQSPDLSEPGPFALADKKHVANILIQGGWRSARIEPFDFGMVVGAGEDPLADAVSYFSRIGPAAAAAREMNGGQRSRFFDSVAKLAERYLHEGIVVFPAAAWIVTARKA